MTSPRLTRCYRLTWRRVAVTVLGFVLLAATVLESGHTAAAQVTTVAAAAVLTGALLYPVGRGIARLCTTAARRAGAALPAFRRRR